jgi:hypothetical protein
MGPMDMTETLLEFPCAFPMKIVGRTEDGFAQAILEVVLRHAPDFDSASMEMRASREGRYFADLRSVPPASSWMRHASCRRIRWLRWCCEHLMDDCADRRRALGDIVSRSWAMRRLGSTDYVATWRAMVFTDARTASTPGNPG